MQYYNKICLYIKKIFLFIKISQLNKNIDHREECKRALDSIRNSIKEAAECDSRQGLNNELLLSALDAACTRKLPQHAALKTDAFDNIVTGQNRLIYESACAPYASAFLLAVPGPDTRQSVSEFRDALWMRLSLQAAVGHDECSPSPQDDPLGLHRLICAQ